MNTKFLALTLCLLLTLTLLSTIDVAEGGRVKQRSGAKRTRRCPIGLQRGLDGRCRKNLRHTVVYTKGIFGWRSLVNWLSCFFPRIDSTTPFLWKTKKIMTWKRNNALFILVLIDVGMKSIYYLNNVVTYYLKKRVSLWFWLYSSTKCQVSSTLHNVLVQLKMDMKNVCTYCKISRVRVRIGCETYMCELSLIYW